VFRSHAQKELLGFIEKFQIPFSMTMDCKGILSEDHPLCIGCLGTTGDPGAKEHFRKSKVVLGIGNSFAQNATFLCDAGLFEDKKLIHINIDKEEIGKVYEADYAIVSDAKPAILGISSELSKIIKDVEPKKIETDLFRDKPLDYDGDKIHPALLCREISKNLPENCFMMGDAGCHMMWLHYYLHLAKGQMYHNPGSFGPMASHVNASMGVKCANPDTPVIVGTGDSSYLMAGFELLTAVQNNIPVIWIIFNNNEFNAIKYYQTFMHNEYALISYENPDYVAYAKACGAKGYRVEKLSDFEKVFKEALDSNEPVLIDVPVDSEVYPYYDLSYSG
jgi:acetolactate synthase-1/2/3 large subunit